ncbi:MAG: hypothetical protein ABJF01_19190 [bacterium]
MPSRIMKFSVALVIVIAACKQSADQQLSSAATGNTLSFGKTDRGDDPCIYLASSEAEPYVGPLATPPFRFDDEEGAPSADGKHCMYRGRDGREIMVDAIAGNATIAAAVTAGVPRVMGRVMKATGHDDQQSVIAAVTPKREQGPWDDAQWFGTIGSLQAIKGDSGVMIDVSASSAGEEGAYALAREAMPRLTKPLEYDGAHAATLAPKPRAPLANPCDLIPRAQVEQAIGPLSAAPQQDTLGRTCTYRVAAAGRTFEYPLDITWINGNKKFAMMKRSIGAAADALGTPGGGGAHTIPPEAQQMLGQISKMTGGAVDVTPLTHGLTSDTTLVGPWDKAALIVGTLAATKHNVMIQLRVSSADYDKAKALLAAACEQL